MSKTLNELKEECSYLEQQYNVVSKEYNELQEKLYQLKCDINMQMNRKEDFLHKYIQYKDSYMYVKGIEHSTDMITLSGVSFRIINDMNNKNRIASAKINVHKYSFEDEGKIYVYDFSELKEITEEDFYTAYEGMCHIMKDEIIKEIKRK